MAQILTPTQGPGPLPEFLVRETIPKGWHPAPLELHLVPVLRAVLAILRNRRAKRIEVCQDAFDGGRSEQVSSPMVLAIGLGFIKRRNSVRLSILVRIHEMLGQMTELPDDLKRAVYK